MAARLIGLFEGLNRLGTTVLVATHDVQLIGRVAGAQVLRLDRGRLHDPTGALAYPPCLPGAPGMTALDRVLPAPGRLPGTLPWLVAATAFIMLLAVAAALALAVMARGLDEQARGRMIVQVIDADGARRDARTARADQAAEDDAGNRRGRAPKRSGNGKARRALCRRRGARRSAFAGPGRGRTRARRRSRGHRRTAQPPACGPCRCRTAAGWRRSPG